MPGLIDGQIEDQDVCAGAVGTQAPILAHDLRSISLASHAAKNFCSTVFGLCPLQQVIPFEVKMQPPPRSGFGLGRAGNDNMSATVQTSSTEGALDVSSSHKPRWRSRGRQPFKVVHLSDVHVDRQYLVRANIIE